MNLLGVLLAASGAASVLGGLFATLAGSGSRESGDNFFAPRFHVLFLAYGGIAALVGTCLQLLAHGGEVLPVVLATVLGSLALFLVPTRLFSRKSDGGARLDGFALALFLLLILLASVGALLLL